MYWPMPDVGTPDMLEACLVSDPACATRPVTCFGSNDPMLVVTGDVFNTVAGSNVVGMATLVRLFTADNALDAVLLNPPRACPMPRFFKAPESTC